MTTVKIASRQCGKAHALRNESLTYCGLKIGIRFQGLMMVQCDCAVCLKASQARRSVRRAA